PVRRRGMYRRGWSLVEMVASALIVSFTLAAAATLYMTWQKQTLLARNYSQAQTDLRTAFHSLLRTLRHGSTVVATSSAGNLNGQTSTTSQVIVTVPQATGSSDIQVLYYQTGGVLYYQRQGDGSGTSIISGVTAFTVHYYKTVTTTSGGVSTITTTATD